MKIDFITQFLLYPVHHNLVPLIVVFFNNVCLLLLILHLSNVVTLPFQTEFLSNFFQIVDTLLIL